MDSNRKTSIIVGTLFIIATVATLVSGLFFWSIYDLDYLTVVSTNETQILISVLFMLTTAAAIVGIPIALFPIIKNQNESLALGYVVSRVFEALFFIVSTIILLAIFSLSHEFVNTSTPVTTYFETSGTLLLGVFDWSSILLDFPFALSAVIINYLFYKSKLIPRWLSLLGLIGGGVFLAATPLLLFGVEDATYMAAIIGIQEMVLAVWLIIKGFNASAIDS